MLNFQTWYMLKNKKLVGFSLIEMLIVLLIISLLTSVLIIKSNVISNYEEKLEIDRFITVLNQTKNKSIKERKIYKVDLFLRENSYYSSINDEKVKFEYIKFVESGTNLSSIAFTIRGVPSKGSAGTIILLGNKSKYKITVTPVTGKINLEKEDDYEKNNY